MQSNEWFLNTHVAISVKIAPLEERAPGKHSTPKKRLILSFATFDFLIVKLSKNKGFIRNKGI